MARNCSSAVYSYGNVTDEHKGDIYFPRPHELNSCNTPSAALAYVKSIVMMQNKDLLAA